MRLGIVRAEPVAVFPSAPQLLSELESLAANLAAKHAGLAPGEIEGLAAARQLYRSFGIDPTRTRPSSEALLRRLLQGKGLPRILNAVDLCTLCSLRFLLPIGLYDAGKIRGEVVLRRGLPGEAYEGIRKDTVSLDGRPVLVDEEGPFGNPTSDSSRTCVDASTRSLWMVIFSPAAVLRELLEDHVRFARERMARYLSPEGHAASTATQLLP